MNDSNRIRRLALVAGLACALAMTGCTSGSDSSGDGSDSGGDNATPGGSASDNTMSEKAAASRIDLIASADTLGSAAINDSDGVVLTAIVRDSDNNAVANPDVHFSSTAGRLVVGDSTANGTATATLYNDTDRADRTIDVTATTGDISDQITIPVTGTRLQLTGPAAVRAGESARFRLVLSDSADEAISDTPIEVTPSARVVPANGSLDTDATGTVSFDVTTTNVGSTAVSASALGAMTSQRLVATSNNLRITAPSTDNTTLTAGQTRSLTVTLRDDRNQPVSGETISFTASRATLSRRQVDTDDNGQAQIKLTGTTSGTATITASHGDDRASRSLSIEAASPASLTLDADPSVVGVNKQSTLTALVIDDYGNVVPGAAVDFTLSEDSPGTLSADQASAGPDGSATVIYTAPNRSTTDDTVITAQAEDGDMPKSRRTLRVAAQALGIRLGRGGDPQPADNDTTLQAPFAVLVTDAAGNAVSDASVHLAVRSLAYDGGDDDAQRIDCATEDTNNNGILDSGEDRNGNDHLDPGPVASVPTTQTTDDSGIAQFDVTYLSQYAERVTVSLSASASVAGSEGSQEMQFTLPGDLASDNPLPACN